MTIPEFIEKAHEGGYLLRGDYHFKNKWMHETPIYERRFGSPSILLASVYEVLLSPEAWEAVGKVEKWREPQESDKDWAPEYVYAMHRMIDALAQGKTIEEFIATL